MNISNQAAIHATQIVDGFEHIKSMSTLEITPDNMATFHQFLDLLSNEHGSEFADNVLAQPQIQKIKPGIQQLFSHASSLYERHWAERIVASDDPNEVLGNEYPYYKHYQRATGLEINAIHSLADEPVKNVLMVGSGALPLTTLALHNSGLQVDNLDINGPDLLLGQQVCQSLSPDNEMTFIHNDICQQGNLAQYDVIWLAALVGDESLKNKIVAHLFEHMKPGAQLVVRTAYNLRTLLYPSIDEQGLAPFQLKLKIQTYADNFHSILIAQKPV
ncbi:nicotianamine synthase family protein [Pseudoalteromonas luteoviolacea]|uniref:nicotianamine synthase family protein n=1 Tax=Pseudoalteromonas luteoviolacea TaxID=43657 RepID=UPI001B3858FE|nr:nicotianamine synthase family protein [Pseudoalteromonas luteoviolacea]MBQ4837193.1 nicotianamine synthase [Pseudoalteromonas luteoviolacea]